MLVIRSMGMVMAGSCGRKSFQGMILADLRGLDLIPSPGTGANSGEYRGSEPLAGKKSYPRRHTKDHEVTLSTPFHKYGYVY